MNKTLCKIFVPYGAIGTGISEESFQNGVKLNPDAIVCDAGSTDSGPYYLGTGKCKYARDTLKEDFARMIKAGHKLHVPVMIGSAGTCGTDKEVNDMFDIAKEICNENNIHAKVALIYCSQNAAVLEQKYIEGKVKPLDGAPKIDENVFDECENIVGVAGAKPFIKALKAGADIVICGRATDTAILAALPLMKGCNPGSCWHGAKTAECGSLCTTNPSGGGVFLIFDEDSFTIEPTSDDSRCTPYTVSAHMIYENANPYQLREPAGILDTSKAVYEALDDRRVRVTGSRFTPMAPTTKLEGSSLLGYQTVTVVGMRDRQLMKAPKKWLNTMNNYVQEKINKYDIDPDTYSVDFKLYGYDALGPASENYVPNEIGIVMIITAKTQELATRIAKIYNPYLLHFPVKLDSQLPSFALLFSPAEIEKGPVYEFRLFHAVDVDNEMDLFRTKMEEI